MTFSWWRQRSRGEHRCNDDYDAEPIARCGGVLPAHCFTTQEYAQPERALLALLAARRGGAPPARVGPARQVQRTPAVFHLRARAAAPRRPPRPPPRQRANPATFRSCADARKEPDTTRYRSRKSPDRAEVGGADPRGRPAWPRTARGRSTRSVVGNRASTSVYGKWLGRLDPTVVRKTPRIDGNPCTCYGNC